MAGRLLTLLRENLLLVAIVTVIAGAYVFLRTPESDVESIAMLDELLQAGQPTLLEVFSNG
jgi:hypothetical protein